jgi:hypothetical protein
MSQKTPKKLPVLGKPSPAAAQRGLAVKPIAEGSRPEFPTRNDLYRKAGLIGGAALLATSLAHAGDAPAAKKAPTPQQQAAPKPAPAEKPAPPAPPPPPQPIAVNPEALVNGSIDGQPLEAKSPKFKVFRSGGGIGPAEDMWDVSEVEAYISWQMAHEGKLAIKTAYKLSYDGFEYELDGFDADKNIGYVYVDKMHGDREYFTKAIKAKLEAWQKAKKVAILYIDVPRNPDAATLKGKVIKFMSQMKKSPPAPGALQ